MCLHWRYFSWYYCFCITDITNSSVFQKHFRIVEHFIWSRRVILSNLFPLCVLIHHHSLLKTWLLRRSVWLSCSATGYSMRTASSLSPDWTSWSRTCRYWPSCPVPPCSTSPLQSSRSRAASCLRAATDTELVSSEISREEISLIATVKSFSF